MFSQAPTTVGHHCFGTDEIGRDYLSRVIYGIRTSEEVGFFVAVVSSIIGLIVGALAGYFGGWLDNILMRITDLVLTLPLLAILLTAAALLGEGSQWRVSIILALFLWTGIARIVRGVFLSLREKEYVEAAKASGAGDIADHVPPHPPEHARPGRCRTARSRSRPRSSSKRRSRSSASASSRRRRRSACSSRRGQNNPQKWWVTVFPGLTIVADRALHQLHRRRAARRARPAAAESPCLSRFCRSATSSSSSARRTGSSMPSTASPTTSSRARRSASSASRARARASARSRSSA